MFSFVPTLILLLANSFAMWDGGHISGSIAAQRTSIRIAQILSAEPVAEITRAEAPSRETVGRAAKPTAPAGDHCDPAEADGFQRFQRDRAGP